MTWLEFPEDQILEHSLNSWQSIQSKLTDNTLSENTFKNF